MSVDSSTPVLAVEGIGPVVERALARIRVHTVYDLLRCKPDQIRRAAPRHLSFRDAAALRSAASLLRVRNMTEQWAEALVAGGVHSVEEFQRRSIAQVLEMLRKAQARRIIRSLPAPEQVEQMLKDAIVLQYTGSLYGTVRDTKGKAIRGAVVRLGRAEQRTDARGRFQLFRLPLGKRSPVLRIAHPRYHELAVEEPRLSVDSELVSVAIFTLKKRRGSAKPPKPVVLSELAGDTLPTPTGQPIRVVPMAAGRFENGDILMVEAMAKNQGPVSLVSRFKSFENGEFIVRTARVARNLLPKVLRERDHLRYASGKFTAVKPGAQTIRKAVMLRAMRREFIGEKKPKTAAQRRRAVAKRIKFLTEQGFFAGRTLLPGAQATPARDGGTDV